ncbi:hydroxymethylbilane synthase [Flavobacteriaceae bacterium]|nr:hydroxymethylbilane synthase [Flavobacteriaceae bacterium]
MESLLRIGTRESALAIWQAERLKYLLKNQGVDSILVPIKSSGDLNLKEPIYSMGIQGVFTKALDTALLSDKIDIAVHSLKDVPTKMPKGVILGAVLQRGNARDVMVYRKAGETASVIGTGSLRRQAQWLFKNPQDRVENLRGNIQKRLQTLDNSKWKGAIFAQAGLERMELLDRKHEQLEWMIPAPAQGAIGICCKEENKKILKVLETIHCEKTHRCVSIEREFLSTLEGGCTAPIGAHAVQKENTLYFKSGLFAIDGSQAIHHEEEIPLHNSAGYGTKAAKKVLEGGGESLMKLIKSQL